MPSLQDRLKELRQAREQAAAQQPPQAAQPAQAAGRPPKLPKVRPALYANPDRRWRPLSEEAAAMLNDQADAILERAAKTPVTLCKALGNYPQPVLRHLCIREKVPVPHSTTRGQVARKVFVDALSAWFQQRQMAAETQQMPVQAHRATASAKRAPAPAPAEEQEQAPPEAASAAALAPASAEEQAEQQFEQWERDCAEIVSGNDSILLWRRVQATLRALVHDGVLAQADADDELARLKTARGL